jgi:hypothetical protein
LRDVVIKLKRDFMNASAVHRGRLIATAKTLEKRYREIEKTVPDIGERFYSIREGRATVSVNDKLELVRGKKWTLGDLSEDAQQLYHEVVNMYESAGKTLLGHGVLQPEQIRGGYFFRSYKNLEDLRKYHWTTDGNFSGVLSEQFTKERAFDFIDESVEESLRNHKLAQRTLDAGKTARQYPVLNPEYDVFKNLARYINTHSEALARKAWREEVTARVGRVIDDFDVNALYDVSKSMIDEAGSEAGRIAKWFGKSKSFKALEEEASTVLQVRNMGVVRHGILALDNADAGAKRLGRADITEIPTRRDIRKGPETKTELDRLRERRAAEAEKAPKEKPEIPVRHPQPRKTERGFTGRNQTSGRAIAEKIRRGDPLSNRDIVEANRIVTDQEGQVRQLLSSRDSTIRFDLTLKPEPKRTTAQKQLAASASREMRALSPQGKREFMRQLLLRTRSGDQLAALERDLWDDFSDFFPKELVETATVTGSQDNALAKLAESIGEDAAEMIPVKSKWTGGVGVHLPRVVAKDLINVNSTLLNTTDFQEFNKMLRGFDWGNNRLKLGVYTLWPASAIRDAYSNMALSMLDIGMQAFNPAYHRDSIKILSAGSSKALMKRFGDDVVFGRFSVRELVRQSEDLGVWVPGEVFAELAGDPKTAGTFFRKAARYRGMIENEARVLLWMANMRRGASPRAAADHVATFLFNYGEVSQVERELFRRLIPFYTFTRKNVALQSKILRTNPGMAINQLKPFRGQREENESMVKWEAEALKLRLDKDGKTLHVLTGIDLPLRNLDTIWAGGFGSTGRRMMGMLTPVLKVPLETVVGRDIFTGGDLKRTRADTLGRIVEATNTPKPVRDWLGWKKDVDPTTGKPRYSMDGTRYALLVRSWMFSRAFSTSDRVFREYLNDPNISRGLLDVLTGLRVKDLNMDEQQRRKLQRRIRELQDSLVRRGVLREFKKPFEPKDRGVF